MKKNFKIILLVAAISAVLWSFVPTKKKEDPEKDRILIELLNYVLQRGHYSPVEINDDFSKKVFNRYIKGLDPTKRFFLQQDYNEFLEYEMLVDDMVRQPDLRLFELTYTRLMLRMDEAIQIYRDLLEKPFDFTKDERINTDYEKLPYSKNKADLKNKWRQQLKLSVLSAITDSQKVEEDKKKKDENYEAKSFEKIEREARESTLKSLDEYFDFIQKELVRADWYSIYINAIMEQYDPHTFYLSPDDKDKFDASISGKFEGIGAKLSKKNEGVEVSELISGGPAWRGKELEVGDLILKVGQGKDEPIDVAGMRLDDVVKKIKGKKGTEVRLTVKKVDGTIKIIPIVRDEVETEETFAKSAVVEKDGKKFGVIYLPKFYISFDNKNNRDAFKDVAQEVERLKEQGVEGIVMDLRSNGGGSLETVVKMTGLFIEKGAVVQVKSANRKREILEDRDPQIQWDGALVVMVDNFSASASEIFAAAIQDYKRGIVIGSKHTFGKGTVQNMYDLNQFVKGSNLGDMGALKTTVQKFYRINGGSTQREGVLSDIVLPDRFTYLDMGERDEDNALPWDKIESVVYSPVYSGFENVIARSRQRTADKEQFKLIDKNAKWISDRKDQNVYELNIEKFKAKLAEADAQIKSFSALKEYDNSLKFNSLPYETAMFEKDATLKEKRERWHEDLRKDAYVEEALNVLSDLNNTFPKNQIAQLKGRK